MNLFRLGADGRVERVGQPLEAEFAFPDWVFALVELRVRRPTARSSPSAGAGGRDRLYRIAAGGRRRPRSTCRSPRSSYVADRRRTGRLPGGRARRGRGRSSSSTSRPARLPRSCGARRPSSSTRRTSSIGRARRVPDDGDRTAFGIFYRADEPTVPRARTATLPPLIVTSHGGPTAQAIDRLRGPASSCSRAAASPSSTSTTAARTGYGTDYRKRLEGEWGVVDLDDCVDGARWLAEQGLVDGERLAIRGGSASGYTTLCAVTFRDAFTAGASYFGIGDLETFVDADPQVRVALPRPADRAVPGAEGPLPRPLAAELHRADLVPGPDPPGRRGPDRPAGPGRADRRRALGAPPAARLPAVRRARTTASAPPTNIIRSFEAELSFYGQVFGFEPADPIEPIEVEFLDADAPRREPRRGRGVTAALASRLDRRMPWRAPPGSARRRGGGGRARPRPIELVLALLIAATVLAIVARRLAVPYPVLLVLGGLAIGFIPGLPAVELEPDVVFLLFLPPILFAAGYFTSIRDLRANITHDLVCWRSASSSSRCSSWRSVAHALVPALGWAAALTLGAIVAPPDAVAATAVFQRLGVPRRIVTILEGESLLNDATALVAYRFAVVAAMVGTFSLARRRLDLPASAALGGVASDSSSGCLTALFVRRVDDPVFSVDRDVRRAARRLPAGPAARAVGRPRRRSPPGSGSGETRRGT